MGSEIDGLGGDDNRARFERHLAAETRDVGSVYRQGGFAEDRELVAGFELEAWLVDDRLLPAPRNLSFLERMASPLVVPELSRFNVEINGTPQALHGLALSTLENELLATWRHGQRICRAQGNTLVAVGTLPTVRQADLTMASMTPFKRYEMLNRQVLKLRGERPLRLDIDGIESLSVTHADVMLEAAATSFQVHLQTPASEAVRAFNASLLLSGPLVALAANSPFLFGRALWHETRIPLFEQAVDCCDPAYPQYRRVTFGSGYLRDPIDFFAENIRYYKVLLPFETPGPQQPYPHLRLHNGTIWRWNRMLIGFDEQEKPHFRVEQRVMPAGPSLLDMFANAAFYYGAVRMLTTQQPAPESCLPFDVARDNFYRAARDGLAAPLLWLDGRRRSAGDLLQHELLPLAREGLAQLELAADDCERYLTVIAERLSRRRTGAAWQLAHYAKHRDFFRLTADYIEQQGSLKPVHEWPI